MKKLLALIFTLTLSIMLVGCIDLNNKGKEIIKEELQALTLNEDLIYEIGLNIQSPILNSKLDLTTNNETMIAKYKHESKVETDSISKFDLNYYLHEDNSYVDLKLNILNFPVAFKYKINNIDQVTDLTGIIDSTTLTPKELNIGEIFGDDVFVDFLLKSNTVSMSKKKSEITILINASKEELIADVDNLLEIAKEHFNITTKEELLLLLNTFKSIDIDLEIVIKDSIINKFELTSIVEQELEDGLNVIELNIKNLLVFPTLPSFDGYIDIPEDFELSVF